MTSAIAQTAIAILSLTAVCLSQSRSIELQRRACLFGLASQPFWLYSTFAAGQWGMFVLSILYTVVWGNAVRWHWFGCLEGK